MRGFKWLEAKMYFAGFCDAGWRLRWIQRVWTQGPGNWVLRAWVLGPESWGLGQESRVLGPESGVLRAEAWGS